MKKDGIAKVEENIVRVEEHLGDVEGVLFALADGMFDVEPVAAERARQGLRALFRLKAEFACLVDNLDQVFEG